MFVHRNHQEETQLITHRP